MRKGFLWAKKKFTVRAKNSVVMKKLMKNKKIARALNEPRERKEFYGKLKDLGEGGLYVDEARELADRLAHGHETKHITRKEGRLIAKGLQEELYPELKMYKRYKPELKPANETYSNVSFSKPATPTTQNISAPTEKTQITPLKMATIMNRMRTNPAESTENDSGSQSKGSFSQALATTQKNKRS